ncbi:copper amine oxidase N-terminal domain-containing protein [Paenibacillus chitinolyticus]|uniref:copper amine oxidase N-terminal domain-containing protein n=1 Tax=Paenibacillus chitinolyticus TaxID=79263 RepID=UPI003CFBDD21
MLKKTSFLAALLLMIAVVSFTGAAMARDYLLPHSAYIEICEEDPGDELCQNFCEDFPDTPVCSGQESGGQETGDNAVQARLDVQFNRMNIKVNGKEFVAPNILYEGTTYLPIRDLANLLELSVNYYGATQTAYIGQLPAGEVPDEVIDEWEKQLSEEGANGDAAAGTLVRGGGTIDVYLDRVQVKVHGERIADSTFLYDGTTYVPMRAACDILELPVNYYGPTSTAYIGEVPAGEVPKAEVDKWKSGK